MHLNYAWRTFCWILILALMALAMYFGAGALRSFLCISMVLWFVWLVDTYRNDRAFFALIFPMLSLGGVVLAFLVEMFGAYTPELEEWMSATGALVRLIFYLLVFFFAAWLAFSYRRPVEPLREMQPDMQKVLLVACVGAILAIIYAYIVMGVPLLDHLNKYMYWRESVQAYPIVDFAKGHVLMLMIGLFLIWKRRQESVLWLLFLTFVVLQVLGGEKYTGFASWLSFFVLVYLVRHTFHFTRKNLRYVCGGLAWFTVFISVMVFYHYNGFSDTATVPFQERLFSRLAEQGQIWWAIDQQMSLGEMHLSAFAKETASWFQWSLPAKELKGELGIYSMMELVTRHEIVLSYWSRSVNFTEAYPAIALYWFGYIGCVFFQILMGVLFGLFLRLYYRAVRRADMVCVFLLTTVYNRINQALGMGNFYALFNLKTIVAILLALAYHRLYLYIQAHPDKLSRFRRPAWLGKGAA